MSTNTSPDAPTITTSLDPNVHVIKPDDAMPIHTIAHILFFPSDIDRKMGRINSGIVLDIKCIKSICRNGDKAMPIKPLPVRATMPYWIRLPPSRTAFKKYIAHMMLIRGNIPFTDSLQVVIFCPRSVLERY